MLVKLRDGIVLLMQKNSEVFGRVWSRVHKGSAAIADGLKWGPDVLVTLSVKGLPDIVCGGNPIKVTGQLVVEGGLY